MTFCDVIFYIDWHISSPSKCQTLAKRPSNFFNSGPPSSVFSEVSGVRPCDLNLCYSRLVLGSLHCIPREPVRSAGSQVHSDPMNQSHCPSGHPSDPCEHQIWGAEAEVDWSLSLYLGVFSLPFLFHATLHIDDAAVCPCSPGICYPVGLLTHRSVLLWFSGKLWSSTCQLSSARQQTTHT
jgi:hypothetical protein